jgi:hypothetical protein
VQLRHTMKTGFNSNLVRLKGQKDKAEHDPVACTRFNSNLVRLKA